jgi:hypothetical protein
MLCLGWGKKTGKGKETTRELKTVQELALILIDIGLEPLSKTIVEAHLLCPSLSLAAVANCLNGLSAEIFSLETTERPGKIDSVCKGIQCGMLENESTSSSHKDACSAASTADSHLDFRARNFHKADIHPPQKSEPPNTTYATVPVKFSERNDLSLQPAEVVVTVTVDSVVSLHGGMDSVELPEAKNGDLFVLGQGLSITSFEKCPRQVSPSPPNIKQGPDAEDDHRDDNEFQGELREGRTEEHASQGGVSPFTNISDVSCESLKDKSDGGMNHVVRFQWMDHDDVRSDLLRTKKEIDDLRSDFQVRVFE